MRNKEEIIYEIFMFLFKASKTEMEMIGGFSLNSLFQKIQRHLSNVNKFTANTHTNVNSFVLSSDIYSTASPAAAVILPNTPCYQTIAIFKDLLYNLTTRRFSSQKMS